MNVGIKKTNSKKAAVVHCSSTRHMENRSSPTTTIRHRLYARDHQALRMVVSRGVRDIERSGGVHGWNRAAIPYKVQGWLVVGPETGAFFEALTLLQACTPLSYSPKTGKDAVVACLGRPCDKRCTAQLFTAGKSHPHPGVGAVVKRVSLPWTWRFPEELKEVY